MSATSQSAQVPVRGKRADALRNQQTLLAAAAEVFAGKGFDAATMTEIAAQSESSIGSLYQF